MFCVIRKIVFIFAGGNDKSHITMSEINQTINLHVSVDCVLIGFDGEVGSGSSYNGKHKP